MTKYKVVKSPGAVDVRLTEVAGQQEDLLRVFEECSEGRCSCPTDEYAKVARMEISSTDEGISIRLEAKTGADMDPGEISRCLDHTIAKVQHP